VGKALVLGVLMGATACSAGDDTDTADSFTPDANVPVFEPASLEPAFEHINATWAGVALLDFDQDGWLDIFLTNGSTKPSGLYRNEGDGTFTDVAASAGLGADALHGAVVSGDIDNDGDPDLVVGIECSVATLDSWGNAIGDGSTVLYRNQGDSTFTLENVDLPAGTGNGPYCPISLELADMNGDGFLDLVSGNGGDLDEVFPWIYRKEVPEAVDHILLNDTTGRFPTAMPILGQSSGAGTGGNQPAGVEFQFVTFTSILLDINNDGRLDRLAGYGGGPLQAFIQNELGELEFVFSEMSPAVGEGLWMGAAIADFDGDADSDIYLTNQGLSPLIAGYDNLPHKFTPDGGDETQTIHANEDGPITGSLNPFHVLVRQQEDSLKEEIEFPLIAPQVLAGDLFDGIPDPETGVLKYPRWIDPPDLARLPWGWGATALDANADGWMDVAFTSNSCSAPMDIIWTEERGAGPGALLLNLEGKAFQDVTWAASVANTDSFGRYQDGRGIATGDLNNDGYADLVVANRTYNPTQSDPLAQEPGTPHVWLSQPREGNWLQVDPVGTISNRDGIGTTVEIVDLNGSQLHVLGAGGGTNSSSERLLTMGLGDTTEVDLKIRFPSGIQVEVNDVAANQRITVEEPAR